MTAQDTKVILPVMTVLERAVLYARVSGDDRSKDGRNLAGQLEMGQEYATEKGYSVVAELPEDDRGASGYEINLPRLSRVREMAQAGQFDVLIVREIDRLSRSLAKQLVVEEELKRAGVRIEYVIGEYPDTPEGRLNKHIKASIAEYEREKINERMTRGKKRAAKIGRILAAGMSPYGYNRVEVNGRIEFEINESEAKIVSQIFSWYTEGKSLRWIVGELNRLNIPRWIETRKEGYRITDVKREGWADSVIGKILSNETYAGVWHYGKYNGRKKKANPKLNWIAIEVPPIVTRKIWDAVQKQKAQNSQFAKRNTKYKYLLQSRIRCACGRSRYGASQKYKYKGEVRGIYFYYRCGAWSEPDKSCRCHIAQFKTEKVDKAVWGWVKSILMDEEKLNQGFEEYQNNQQKKNAPILRQLEITNDLITQRNKGWENKVNSLNAVSSKRAKARLGKEIAQIEEALDRLEAQKVALDARLKVEVFTPEQIADIKLYAVKIQAGLSKADESFEGRRQIIDLLDVCALCAVEDGAKILYVECRVGKKVLYIATPTNRDSLHNTQEILLTTRLVL